MTNSLRCAVCSNSTLSDSDEPRGAGLCVRCDVILRRLSDRLVPLYDVEPDRISLSTSFLEDLDTDSMDEVELASALEEEFGVEISDQEAEEIKTVADLVRLLTTRSRA